LDTVKTHNKGQQQIFICQLATSSSLKHFLLKAMFFLASPWLALKRICELLMYVYFTWKYNHKNHNVWAFLYCCWLFFYGFVLVFWVFLLFFFLFLFIKVVLFI